jgi:hypothetical protein
MRKITLITSILIYFSISCIGQAKQPQLMVVPDDIYCIRKGYIYEFDDNGIIKKVPDYKTALQNDQELRMVISKLNELILNRGWEKLLYLEKEMGSNEEVAAELNAITSKKGTSIAESPIDQLKRKAKADIIIGIDFEIKTIPGKRYIHFNLQGYDSYTNAPVGSASGDGDPTYTSSATVGVLLEEAVLEYMDNFLDQLQLYFDNLFIKGRECNFRIQIFDTNEIDLESEYLVNGDQEELRDVIDEWFKSNSVEGRYNFKDGSENFMLVTARIPLYDENQQALDAYNFIKGLRKYLNKEPFKLQIKTYQRGLGSAWLIIGEK